MMSGYDFDAYVHSIARRQPRRLPACLSVCPFQHYTKKLQADLAEIFREG